MQTVWEGLLRLSQEVLDRAADQAEDSKAAEVPVVAQVEMAEAELQAAEVAVHRSQPKSFTPSRHSKCSAN